MANNNFQYNIGINVNADTKQAEQQFSNLKTRLTELSAQVMGQKMDLSKGLNADKAAQDVIKLTSIVNNSTDVFGKLDLGKFTQSLNASHRTLHDYAASFKTLGVEGQKAFLQINAAVASAEKPLIRAKGLLQDFVDQMARTTSIQLSYGILNSFVDIYRNGISYAQKLDKSLTDIQIVTKQNTAEITKFAERANRAAKELSVSTTEYTDAALIFYQQGLDDEAVKERTDVTIKMANASGEAAKDISSYMTAIWNNFDDGSKSLEYYADVIAKLGADTAASNADIAEGMQDFAAVADTVGLSFEYASSALALLVDKTQQSANVIGNSLKTIFARLESVSLGDTLEDDTNLTKYTKALAVAGVDIKEANGSLKDMDTILDELGAKWQGLNEQQKMGIAYTVAGVRQYNNFISLMDSYDDYLDLIEKARNSTGELNKEQEIYAKSWEAARDQVQAAAQGIYQSILDDEFFKSLTRATATVLNMIEKIIDGFGGIRGAMLLIGSVASTVLKDKIANGLRVIGQEVYNLTPQGQKQMAQMQKQAWDDLTNPSGINMNELNATEQAKVETMRQEIKFQKEIEKYQDRLTQQQKEELATRQSILHTLSEEVIKSQEILQKSQEVTKTTKNKVTHGITDIFVKSNENDIESIDQARTAYSQMAKVQGLGDYINEKDDASYEQQAFKDFIAEAQRMAEQSSDIVKQKVEKDIHSIDAAFTSSQLALIEYEKKLKEVEELRSSGASKDRIDEALEEANELHAEAENFAASYAKKVNDVTTALTQESNILYIADKAKLKLIGDEQEQINQASEIKNLVRQEAQALEDERAAMEDVNDAQERLNTGALKLKQTLQDFLNTSLSMSQILTNITQLATQFGLLVSSGVAIKNTLNNDDLSGWEKFTTILGSLVTILPTAISLYKALFIAREGHTASMVAETAASLANVIGAKTQGQAAMKLTAQKIAEAAAHTTNAAAEGTETAATLGLAGAFKLLNFAIGPLLPGLILLGSVLGIAAAAFKVWYDSTPEGKIKTLSKENERLTSVVEETTTAYEKLNDTIKGLDDAYTTIDKLTKGTYEWAEAARQVNNDIKDIVDKYGLEYGKDWEYIDGVAHLTKRGETTAKNKAKEDMETQERAKIASDIAINTQEVKKYDDWKKSNVVQELQRRGLDINDNSIDWSNPQSIVGALQKLVDEGKLDKNYYTKEYLDGLAKSNTLNNIVSQEDYQKYLDSNNKLFNNYIQYAAQGLGLEDDYAAAWAYKAMNSGIDLFGGSLTNQDYKDYAEQHGLTYQENSYGKAILKDENGENVQISADDVKSFKNLHLIAESIGQVTDEDVEQYKDKQPSALTDYNESERQRSADHEAFSKDDIELLEKYKQYLIDTYDIEEEMADRIASANMRYNRGLEDIIKNYEDYVEALKEANKGSEDYVNALDNVRKDFAYMMDLDPSVLDEAFVTSANNLKLLKEAANGSYEAITQLQENMANSVTETAKNNAVLTEDMINDFQQLKSIIDNSELFEKNYEIGMTLDDDPIVQVLNDLVANAGMSVEEAQKILNSLGFEPDVEWKEVPMDEWASIQNNTKIKYKDSEGNEHEATMSADLDTSAFSAMYVPIINGSKTTYRGSPQAKTSAGNKQGMAKNAKGGGGSKAKTKKLDDERERYHVINKQLTAINKELDNISKAKDRAFGQKHLDYLDAEIKKYEELAKTQQQYIDEIQSYWNSDAAKMKGYGAQIDPVTGTILNYDQLMANAVAQYNAAGGSEGAEEWYNTFKKNLSNYEDSVAKMQEANAQLTDYLNAIYDARLEKIKYRLELKLDMAEDTVKYLDFLMNLLEDDTYDVADRMNLIAGQGEQALNKIDAINDSLLELFQTRLGKDTGLEAYNQLITGQANLEEIAQKLNLTADEVDFLRECVEKLETETVNFKETFDKLNQELINSMQKFGEKIDEQVNKVEHLNNVLEKFKDITNLIGKRRLGSDTFNDLLSNINANSMNLAIKELGMRQKEYQAAKKAYEDAVAAGIDADTLSKLEDELNQIEETFMESWEAALQKSLDLLTEGLEQATTKFGDAVSGLAGSLDELSFWYNKAQEAGDNYLDKYERVYNLNKLIRDITNSMDNTDDLAGKKQLKSLMEEIEELNEKDANVSAYQLDTLQKRYELYQAEIALREAENAKSQVRMVADAEGNYNYMYTADENNIAEAQGNYEDKLFAYAQANTQQIEELQQRLIENRRKLSEELAALGEGDQEKAQELIDWYTEQEAYLEEQMQLALDCNVEVNEYAIASDWDVADNFAETVYSQITGYETLEEVQQNWQDAVTQMAEDVASQFEIFDMRYEAAMAAAGTSTMEFANVVDGSLAYVQQRSDEAAQSAQQMSDDFVNSYGQALSAASQFAQQYANVAQSVISNNVQMIKSIGDLIRQLAAIGGPSYSGISNYVTSAIAPAGIAGIDKLNNEIEGQKALNAQRANNNNDNKNNQTYTISLNNKVVATNVTGGNLSSWLNGALRDSNGSIRVSKDGTYGLRESVSVKEYLKYFGSGAFDTGGYTGEWGTDGRWALLHQKELVLNQEDTENMLAAVNAVRRIAELSNGLSYASRADLSGKFDFLLDNQGLNQNVTIQAEFPNAVDHSEIEMAFNDLLNRASQYANRH